MPVLESFGVMPVLVLETNSCQLPDFMNETLLLSLLSGTIGSVIGAVLTVYFQVRSDRAKRGGDIRFQIYMLLHDLGSAHFWITSAEFRNELASPDVRLRFDRLRWKIADLLRQVGDLPELDAIMDAMMSPRFKSETDRAKAIEDVMGQLDRHVNPNYVRKIRSITQENQSLMAGDLPEFTRLISKTQRDSL